MINEPSAWMLQVETPPRTKLRTSLKKSVRLNLSRPHDLSLFDRFTANSFTIHRHLPLCYGAVRFMGS